MPSRRSRPSRHAVTAALYYHFRTKENILESLVTDIGKSVDDLVAWARSAPSTRERREELLRRLAALAQSGVGGTDQERTDAALRIAFEIMP